MSDQQNQDQQLTLDTLRDRIDALDEQIGELISDRAKCAMEVAKVKSASTKKAGSGEGDKVDSTDSAGNTDKSTAPKFYRPEREAQVLRKAMARNKGPLKDEEFARLFREIMSACLALEEQIQVAFLGPEGTFTQEAAVKHFGHSANALSIPTIDAVFREVESGAAHYGVVPVENSTEGVVTHTLDSFIGSNVKICGEVVLRIHHNLLVSDVTHTDKITRIYSHAQSLSQCRKWLDTNFPNADRIAVSSNSEAAKRIKGEWNAAAIAGEMAGELYDLHCHAKNIEDMPDNSTRFLIIGSEEVGPSGDDKTSVVVSTKNKPGALHDLLAPFHEQGVDLTRVESRPSRTGIWNYVFFIDFAGHCSDPHIDSALTAVAERVAELKVLGSYPRGVL